MKPSRFDEQFELNDGKAVRLMNFAAAAIGVCLVLFVAWSVLTPIDEVAKARGVVEPISEVQQLQTEHGGALASVLVRKGDIVSLGDTIAVFDHYDVHSELREAQAKALGLALERERLLSLVEGRQPDFQSVTEAVIKPVEIFVEQMGEEEIPQADKRAIHELIEREVAALESREAFLENERQVVQRQIAEKRADLEAIGSERPAVERQLAVAKELTTTLHGLVDRGLASRPRLVEAVKEEAKFDYELATLSGRKAVIEAEIAELQESLERIDLNEASDARARIAEINGERRVVDEQIARLRQRALATELKSPVYGYVQSVPDTVVGRVIEPGGIVAEIVPRDVGLRFAAQLQPRDVGFVSVGQHVNLKIDAFDFSRYGALQGSVLEVSPTTIVDERGAAYYEVLVEVPVTYFRNNPEQFALLPGMTGEADILTGKKTVFEYIWKPIFTNLDLALSER
ncbi:HlyD family type I secretion periplasmic adaptor subunit [Pseudovibrio sp. SPO723]|uniref:HlyD family type I secretion periplasmic adaptor subunit n=1 Tax=Nesiotobacter zosterae TaxID=392721 RepID=UPI0029C50DA7|nr:HlyD family type I secretion periplasmic adaptor subunit [Pseudovibrio sp. SPO723]MDX5595465.1 HlyD family type I secretion periplasmic adaptor subunit [Pseudovibrio sp. SPO723]